MYRRLSACTPRDVLRFDRLKSMASHAHSRVAFQATNVARICLNMIVKNETAIIDRCLDSVLPFISHYVMCDTGSTDNTVDLIRHRIDSAGIPGEILHTHFDDFAQARNEALDAAR